jgi:hypothetical protein
MPVKFPPLLGLISAVAALCLALAPAALGAKGGGASTGGTSSISAPRLVNDTNGNGLRNWGDTVVFDVSTTATDQPFVNVQCVQNGALVYNSWNGYFDGALNRTRNFGFSSPSWKSGAADCVAYLDMYSHNKWNTLASTSFHVDG